MRALWAGLIVLWAGSALAAPVPYTGPDLSGNYSCTGTDVHDGAYKGTAVLKLDRTHSKGLQGSYTFTSVVEGGLGSYYGSAAAEGAHMAMTFNSRDASTHDHGTALATIELDAQGHIHFISFYYEPDYFGGNTGTEDCIRH